ncbi:MAG: helix-turn-helix domain-containing protein [Sphingomonas sp.]|uniref:helix-turn-helix domain-containing protein n=1 Tax=Sphingomonas sp. TaxID=28214 RepID=UPI001828AB68|nr:helix-turn-helix domain-containing protein [Sphingomonas sp.]MBA3668310.1 helix-turn-helix domain-containing protein [Sphingomonas sp.]
MDEIEPDGMVTVGQRLKQAREAKGLSIEDVASTTRIPMRHLASIEIGDWDALPASTYSIGFAKNYAVAVGLDRAEIGDALRAEMGGSRPTMTSPEVYETIDPSRAMPKALVLGALGLVLLAVILFTWLGNRSVEEGVPSPEAANAIAVPDQPVPAAPTTSGPVVLTANESVWIEVKDGTNVLKQGELAAGQSYEVPATAAAPVLTTGKPEALRISVGTADAPAVGPTGQRVTGVSLRASDLLRGPRQSTATSPPASVPMAATAAPAKPRAAVRRRDTPPAPAPATTDNSIAPATPGQ